MTRCPSCTAPIRETRNYVETDTCPHCGDEACWECLGPGGYHGPEHECEPVKVAEPVETRAA